MTQMIFGLVGAMTGLCGLVLSIVASTRSKKKDDLADGQNIGSLHTDIGYIKKGIDGIEHRLEKQESQYIEVVTQLAEVKGEVKRHNKRLEKLESFHLPN